MFPPKCSEIQPDQLPEKISQYLYKPYIYHKLEFNELLSNPYFFGICEHTTEIPIHQFEGSAIFRFISLDGKPLIWPTTFQINVCNVWLEKVTTDRSFFYYLPPGFNVFEKVIVRCGIETTPFLFIIQKVTENPNLLFSIPVVSSKTGLMTSPLSGQKLMFPARSQYCQHDQCTEIDEYVAYVDRKGKCPICGINVSLSSTVIDQGIHRQALIDILIKNQSKEEKDYADFDFDFLF